MPNQFCRYLSNGYSFRLAKNNSVKVAPCCLYKTAIPLDSNLLRNRELAFNQVNEWTSNCNDCKILEDAGQQSLRQTGADWIDDDENSQDAISIDIHLDNKCNAACVTCNEQSSSLWKKENSKLNNEKIKINMDDGLINQNIDNIVGTVSLEKLKYIKFFGGEPLFTNTHLKFLQHVPQPDQVVLHYTTNGSIYPNDETLAMWKKFKTIIFAVSLDGIENQFDYVRWPLPWNKVSANLIKLKKNKDIWNLMFRVEFTANFLNAYYFDRLENWVNNNLKTNLSGDKTEINIHPCWGGIWDLEKMPLGIRTLIFKKYPNNHVIHNLVANSIAPTDLEPWVNFVNIWDLRRNTSWKTAFPELVEYLNL